MKHATAQRYTACTAAPTVYLALGYFHGDPFNWNVFLAAILILIVMACIDMWRFDGRI